MANFRKETRSDTFRGWLRTITHNKVYDHFRRLGREPAGAGGTDAQIRFASLPADSAPEDDDSGVQRAEIRICREVLDQIRCEFEDRTWQAFWLTAVEGRPATEVAIDLGMSPGPSGWRNRGCSRGCVKSSERRDRILAPARDIGPPPKGDRSGFLAAGKPLACLSGFIRRQARWPGAPPADGRDGWSGCGARRRSRRSSRWGDRTPCK